jgi:threonine/homoserine/homoserine lactone efflux protein
MSRYTLSLNIKNNQMKAFKNGLITGVILQLAVGPVFFFIMNIAIQRTLLDGFVAVCAVTIADYIFIILVILGLGKLLENKRTKKIFGIISSIVLVLFGIVMIRNIVGNGPNTVHITDSTNLV